MIRSIVFSILVAFVVIPEFAYAQGTPKFFPILSSSYNGPYDIISAVFSVTPVTAGLLSNDPHSAVVEALALGLKDTEAFAKKNGGDAVVNTSMQVVFYPAIRPNGAMGQVIIYGTVVKLKPDTK